MWVKIFSGGTATYVNLDHIHQVHFITVSGHVRAILQVRDEKNQDRPVGYTEDPKMIQKLLHFLDQGE